MRSVSRILSIKTFVENVHTDRIIEYSNALSSLASCQEGYIKSNSYWGTNDKELIQLYTISKWDKRHYWKEWFESEDRLEFHLQIDTQIGNIIKSNNIIPLYKMNVNKNMHLL